MLLPQSQLDNRYYYRVKENIFGGIIKFESIDKAYVAEIMEIPRIDLF